MVWFVAKLNFEFDYEFLRLGSEMWSGHVIVRTDQWLSHFYFWFGNDTNVCQKWKQEALMTYKAIHHRRKQLKYNLLNH